MNEETKISEINVLAVKAYNKLILRTKSYLRQVGVKLNKNEINKERKLTRILAVLFLSKNVVTIKTIKQLLSHGQLDEGLILMRVVIERSALVYKSLEKNLRVDEIERLRGSDCIKYLKRHFDIGKLYGLFSDITHSRPYPSIFFAIVDFYSGGKKVKAEKMVDIKLLLNILLIFVLEVNFAITEFFAKDYIKLKPRWSLKDNFWTYLPISGSRFRSIYEGLITCYDLYDTQ